MNTAPRRIGREPAAQEDLRSGGRLLVDKSRFMPEILRAANVVLIARPHGFGKTTTLSMLRSFLSLDFRNPNDRSFPEKRFARLAVSQNKAFVEENMGPAAGHSPRAQECLRTDARRNTRTPPGRRSCCRGPFLLPRKVRASQPG